MPGYWWECDSNPAHKLGWFGAAHGPGIACFMYFLAASDWDQTPLTIPCRECERGVMRINYLFPRNQPVQLAVRRIVGVTKDLPGYLPMMWEADPRGEEGPWFDFKYVGYDAKKNRLQAYGLARPAVFSRETLVALFDLYRRVTGAKDFP